MSSYNKGDGAPTFVTLGIEVKAKQPFCGTEKGDGAIVCQIMVTSFMNSPLTLHNLWNYYGSIYK